MADCNSISYNETQSNNQYPVNIECIPDMILLDIFSRLNFADLCMCSRVCQRWYMLSRDFSLRKKIVIKRALKASQFNSLIHHHFSNLLEEFQLLKTAGTMTLLSVKKNTLWKLSNRSSKLKKLVLMSCSLASVSLKDMPSSLLHLSVRGSEIYPDLFFGTNPHFAVPHLTCLDIGGVSNFLTSQDLHVFSTLKSLRSLYLEGCFRINNGGIESIVTILPQLEILDVEGTDISNEGVRTIFDNCANIRELYIGHTSINDDAFSRIVKNKMPHLTFCCVRNTNISSASIHTFIMHHLSNKKLMVKADFDWSSSIFKPSDLNSEMDDSVPYLADIRCHHYLNHKC